MIIIDENVEQYWINLLEKEGYPVLSIRKKYPQLPDNQIVELTKQHKGLLITEDKDFGELVFSHGTTGVSIIFLRYDQPHYDLIQKQLLEAVAKHHEINEHYFITITKHNVRIRRI